MKNKDKLFIYASIVTLFITEILKYTYNYYFGLEGTWLFIARAISYISLGCGVILLFTFIIIPFDRKNQKILKWLDFLSCLFIFANFISGAILAYLPIRYGEDYDDIKDTFKNADSVKIPKVEVKKKYPLIVYGIFFILVVALYYIPFPKSLMIKHTSSGLVYGELLMYPTILFFAILLFFDELYDGIKTFVKNFDKYIKRILKVVVIVAIVNIIYTLLVTIILNTESLNEVGLASVNRVTLFAMATIYAPIVEEILFRSVLRKFIKNNIAFIIISALSFGLFHTIGTETETTNFILFTFMYSIPGFLFAYLYEKTNNIAVPAFVHLASNFLASIF